MKLAEDSTGYILVSDNYDPLFVVNDNDAVAAYGIAKETIDAFWTSVTLGAKVTCCEFVTGEYRFKVCVGMPDHIIAYMDYVEPKEELALVEMQYINRRISDGALWPTFCQITSEGWEQIGAYPIEGRHEVGDTVLIFSRFAKKEADMERAMIVYNDRPEAGMNRIKTDSYSAIFCTETLINFSKGDHLSESEREAWHQEATGYQESYYSSFK